MPINNKSVAWLLAIPFVGNSLFSSSLPMSREQFKKTVLGKTQQEVMRALGKPSSVLTIATEEGPCEVWNYRGVTYHPVTKNRDLLVGIRFSEKTNRAYQVDF